jgi:coproporphyrinogen III oxidase
MCKIKQTTGQVATEQKCNEFHGHWVLNPLHKRSEQNLVFKGTLRYYCIRRDRMTYKYFAQFSNSHFYAEKKIFLAIG